MILSVVRPYFAPFAGFFYQARLSDQLVVLDNVQFPRGTTWLTRNRFKNAQGTLWMTIPVWKKGLGLQQIDEVRICHEGRWAEKHTESLKSAYAHAPYFRKHFPFLEKLFSAQYEKLIDFNLAIIRHLIRHLGLKPGVTLLSETGITTRGDALLISLCRHMGASALICQGAAKKYLNIDVIQKAGLGIYFFNPPALIYPQLWGDFIPNLSAFDLLLNCGPKACDILFEKHNQQIPS